MNSKSRKKASSIWPLCRLSHSQALWDAVLSLLNIPICMQVSEQVDAGLLSLWFLFRKQHVRDDGGDGEQSGSIIISALFRNTTLILEVLLMHLPVKFRIKKLHYSSALILARNLGGKTEAYHLLLDRSHLSELKWVSHKLRYLNTPLLEVLLENYKYGLNICFISTAEPMFKARLSSRKESKCSVHREMLTVCIQRLCLSMSHQDFCNWLFCNYTVTTPSYALSMAHLFLIVV